jgi:phosphate:Na+ symporter
VPTAPKDIAGHQTSMDVLSRDIRAFAAAQFRPGMAPEPADLVASLIEEADFAASLGETLHQVARRVEREEFSAEARTIVDAILDRVGDAMCAVLPGTPPDHADREAALTELRSGCLRLGDAVKPAERGAILALLGSAERAFLLIDRLAAERASVPRVARPSAAPAQEAALPYSGPAPAPAE